LASEFEGVAGLKVVKRQLLFTCSDTGCIL